MPRKVSWLETLPKPAGSSTSTRSDREGQLDFRGSAVHGKRGDRFIYLTWGNVGEDGTFHMFRRAKLMLNRVDRTLIDRALAANIPLVATVHLTDKHGGPRCARVDPPALTWTLG